MEDIKAKADTILQELSNTPNADNARDFLKTFLAGTATPKPKFQKPSSKHATGDTRGGAIIAPGAVDLASDLSHPRRMIDIESGNMVDSLNIGPLGQYCILSHSWKGSEVVLQYLWDAKKDESHRYDDKNTQRNDVDMIQFHCKEEIKKQGAEICRLKHKGETLPAEMSEFEKGEAEFGIVKKVLKDRLDVKDAEDKRNKSIRELNEARAFRKYEANEAKIYNEVKYQMVKEMGDFPVYAIDQSRRSENDKENQEDKDGRFENTESDDETESDEEKKSDKEKSPRKREEDSEKSYEKAQKEYDRLRDKREMFNEDHILREAVDKLISLLERHKSANKIKNSIERAKAIYDTKIFGNRERKYIWNDTCCINKADHNEYIDAIARMGEWYRNADFCLVHLDSPKSYEEWNQEWEKFHPNKNLERKPRYEDRIESWEKLKEDKFKPTWATRGWTLQELVLSKVTFYVNDNWDFLNRPAEKLGSLYYICPLLRHYLGTDLDVESTIEEPHQQDDEEDHVRKAQELKEDLQTKGVELRSSIDEESARVQIARAVTNGIEKQLGDFVKKLECPNENLAQSQELDRLGSMLMEIFKSHNTELRFSGKEENSRSKIANALRIAIQQELANYDVMLETSTAEHKGSTGNGLTKQLETAISEIISAYGMDNLHGPSAESVKIQVARAIKVEIEMRQSDYRNVINKLLRRLYTETVGVVRQDKEIIAKFSNVRALRKWRKSTGTDRYAAHQVMSLACKRETTVPADQAYSLMGLLQVRFTAFHAEGITKALSRLIDEVLVTTGDVSVFNWAGRDLRSPVKGRSMYPSSLDAFRTKKEHLRRQKERKKQLAEQLRIRRNRISEMYMTLIELSNATMRSITDPGPLQVPVTWLTELLNIIRIWTFTMMGPHMYNIKKLFEYIEASFKWFSKKSVEQRPTEFLPSLVSPVSLLKDNRFSPFKSPGASGGNKSGSSDEPKEETESTKSQSPLTLPPWSIDNKFPKYSKFSSKKTTVEPSSSGPASKSQFGLKTLPMPKANIFSNKNSQSSGRSSQPGPDLTPTSDPPSQPSNVPESSPTPMPLPFDQTTNPQEPTPGGMAPATGSVLSPSQSPRAQSNDGVSVLDKLMKDYLERLKGSNDPIGIPEQLSKFLGNETKTEDRKRSKDKESKSKEQSIKNHEHVISPNPIIVSNSGLEAYLDIQRVVVTILKRERLLRLMQGAGPNDKISGWCKISTGLSVVIVGFTCEKRLLEKQLQVIDVVNHTALTEESQETDQGDQPLNQSSIDKIGSVAKALTRSDTLALAHVAQTPSKHEKRIKQMIEFVAEKDLKAIAGEWVLARISGVKQAKWFLCSLEIGSTREFYGTRIATDEIKLESSSPEPGVIDAWERYMLNQKNNFCLVMYQLLKARSLEEYKDKWLQSLEPEEDDSDPENPSTGLKAKIKQEALNRTKGAVDAAWGQFQDVLAKQGPKLNQRIQESALREVPRSLRPAIEALNRDEQLPMVFQTAQVFML